jgi:hypothetical protein
LPGSSKKTSPSTFFNLKLAMEDSWSRSPMLTKPGRPATIGDPPQHGENAPSHLPLHPHLKHHPP